MADVTVEVFGRPGCHLCDEAISVVTRVVGDFPATRLVERNVIDDAEWFDSMKDDIPVVVINGERHARWRVDEDALRSALKEATA